MGRGRSPASGPAVVAAIEAAFEPLRFRPEQAAGHPLTAVVLAVARPEIIRADPDFWYAESRLSGPRGYSGRTGRSECPT